MSKKPIEEQSAEELVDYIRTSLRPELQQRREANETYEAAFGKFKDAERKGLLHMIRQFGDDRQRGATLFRELSDTILPREPEPTPTPKQEEEPTMSEDTKQEDSEEVVPQWAQAIMSEFEAMKADRTAAQEQENTAAIEQLKTTARGFGFVEGTDEWARFFSIAASDLAGGDLEVAKGIYEKLDGPLPGAGEPDPEPEPEASGEPRYPKTGGAGGDGAVNSAEVTGDEIDFSDKRAVYEAAMQYMESYDSDNAATP